MHWFPSKRNLLFLIFPKLRLLKFSFESAKCCYGCYKKVRSKPDSKFEATAEGKAEPKSRKMNFGQKLAIGCGIFLLFSIGFSFIAFPNLIKGKVKKMITLDPTSEVRQMFVKVPFGLEIRIYLFNVTNPMEVHNGGIPIVQEVGPFCFYEWKEKVDVKDEDSEDAMFYKPKDTFFHATFPGCLSGDEILTVPHPLIVGMVNAANRAKPGALGLLGKAIKSIFRNPDTIFIDVRAMDLIFDGIVIKCDVKDFGGKAVCTQLRNEAPDLRHLSETDLGLALLAPKNGTPGKEFKVLRGTKKSRDVGQILEYDGKEEIETWPTQACNQIHGTDGTIFAPLMKRDEGLVSFSPDLCRSLVATYSRTEKYEGLKVDVYTASLGDMSKNPEEKCYCPTPETCLKKGALDLFKCVGAPIIATLPHFYDSDESYLKGVKGLTPNEEEHGIRIYFERFTGSPVKAAKRLMFNIPLQPVEKVPIFKNLPNTLLPFFWLEESVALNSTFTKPLNQLFLIKKIVKIFGIFGTILSIIGLLVAGFLIQKHEGELTFMSSQKITPSKHSNNAVNSKFGGDVNHVMSDNEIEKF